MSKNFTPASTAEKCCTQSPAPVFRCVDTTVIPPRQRYRLVKEPQRCQSSFYLLLSYRRKRFAYSYKPLPDVKRHAGSLHINSSTSYPVTRGFNTSCFMRKFVKRSGLIAMLMMIVGLFVCDKILAQNTGFQSPSTNAAIAGGGFSNPQNAYSQNGIDAIVADDDAHRYGGFNFTIPSDAIVTGIEVRVRASRSG